METASAPQSGRTIGIRLSDIPLAVRRRFGAPLYEAAVKDGDIVSAMEFDRAIERPSESIYFVPEVAVRRVLKNGRKT